MPEIIPIILSFIRRWFPAASVATLYQDGRRELVIMLGNEQKVSE